MAKTRYRRQFLRCKPHKVPEGYRIQPMVKGRRLSEAFPSLALRKA